MDKSQNESDLNTSQSLNHLLATLPKADYLRLAPYLRQVKLSLGCILYEPGELITTVYFPNQSMISLVQIMEDGSTIEAGIVGNDGIVGYSVYLGGEYTMSRAIVQIPGSAIALDAAILKAEFERSSGLQKLLLRYTQALLAQISQTAACNRFHPTEERLARWLLQSQDFARSATLQLTQDFLSSMLGTRRASITVAARTLQQAGLINYNRGHIQILNREALESAACECYSIVRSEYDRLLDIQTN
ncbi:Crp/Fnr family transcriptional regulator [Halotia branconii]|uniref:Crp/Fnr family transcriptional regulator n=1 Tax=Halotia branconii CENA392 TaxID=1539056 RepID=A0AAJ6NVZ7_9CYAN|nr:Crp/Fnr family transcriptional regulator [Halotia branconii]WGV27489.1 Crp/Fnr family transcriptional regulator [Halotia branconii CENA392]